VAYLNAIRNVKPETQNWRLEPTSLAKPREIHRLTGTGLGIARQLSAGWVLGQVRNWNYPVLLSKPGLLADYPDLLLILVSMKVVSKHSIAMNNSRCASSWRLYLHCGIEETSSSGIICINCHQVLHNPSDHVTTTIGTHMLAQAHVPKLNELTELEVNELTCSTIDEAAFPILKSQVSRGITIVSLQRKFIFAIQVDPYLP